MQVYCDLSHLMPNSLDYPFALRRCSRGDVSPNATLRGEVGLLDKRSIGFFCSVRCPGDIVLRTYDLARALRNADGTIVGGFQSPMEKECLSLLLRGTVRVVLCPARGLNGMRVPAEWEKSLANGRFLLLSFFDDSVRRVTTDLAAKRNAYVAALADRILIAHAERGGKTEGLCRDALARRKPVFALDSPDNAHLIDLGAKAVRAEDPTALLEL